MKIAEIANPPIPSMLFHGTLRSLIPHIVRDGLVPQKGAMTKSLRRYSFLAKPLVYAVDQDNIDQALSAIIFHTVGDLRSLEDYSRVIADGAMAVIVSDAGKFQRHPRQNFYVSDQIIQVDKFLIGENLSRLFGTLK